MILDLTTLEVRSPPAAIENHHLACCADLGDEARHTEPTLSLPPATGTDATRDTRGPTHWVSTLMVASVLVNVRAKLSR